MSEYDDAEDPRFSFGLTEFQVQRLQKILTRLEDKEVKMSEAWGRACELLAMLHAMMEVITLNDRPWAIDGRNNERTIYGDGNVLAH